MNLLCINSCNNYEINLIINTYYYYYWAIGSAILVISVCNKAVN
jgi:hypothetical protein